MGNFPQTGTDDRGVISYIGNMFTIVPLFMLGVGLYMTLPTLYKILSPAAVIAGDDQEFIHTRILVPNPSLCLVWLGLCEVWTKNQILPQSKQPVVGDLYSGMADGEAKNGADCVCRYYTSRRDRWWHPFWCAKTSSKSGHKRFLSLRRTVILYLNQGSSSCLGCGWFILRIKSRRLWLSLSDRRRQWLALESHTEDLSLRSQIFLRPENKMFQAFLSLRKVSCRTGFSCEKNILGFAGSDTSL